MGKRYRLLAIFIAAISVFAYSGLAMAGSDDSGSVLERDDGSFDRQICRPPISTCEFRDTLTSGPQETCSPGFSCTCVPSCPECDDCAAQVCIPDPSRECRTACDCAPGLGCFDNQCIAGFAPVYCCDSDRCPAGNQCQHRDGTADRCEDPPDDRMCLERIEKVTRAVDRVVQYFSYCRQDEDCTRVQTSTECLGTCGDFVNVRAVKTVGRIINKIDRSICSSFTEDGCRTPISLCKLTEPACIDNRCVDMNGPILERPREPLRESRVLR